MRKGEIINLLTNTPVDWRKDLHSIIMEAENIHNQKNSLQEKVKNLRQRFINKIKERAWNSELINRLINNAIHLDAFRRAWTEKKETEINEILKAKNIEDIKHILNNPKYSHIWRWSDNKWWIEISAIIDEVVSWKLSATYIPSEIRQKVQELINK